MTDLKPNRKGDRQTMEFNAGLPLDIDRATDWVRGSLAQGSALAELSSATLGRLRAAFLLAPNDGFETEAVSLGEDGRRIRAVDADAVASTFLKKLRELGGRTLIVENDLARRGDGHLADDVGFVGDRVILWTEITPDISVATSLLRRGSSGYPLNAYVSRRSPIELGLGAKRQLGSEDIALVADSVLAIIVSVFDAEAFVAVVDVDSPA